MKLLGWIFGTNRSGQGLARGLSAEHDFAHAATDKGELKVIQFTQPAIRRFGNGGFNGLDFDFRVFHL
jgi:hypothetical protein